MILARTWHTSLHKIQRCTKLTTQAGEQKWTPQQVNIHTQNMYIIHIQVKLKLQ